MKRIFPLAVILLAWGCKEDLGLTKPFSDDKIKPGIVANLAVVNKPGAARITYKIPNDNDLLYIKAVYEIRPGVSREVKASYSNDSLIVDGFGAAKPYEVKLYAVDKAENASDPVTITVNPLKPPFVNTLEQLVLANDFGGVSVGFSNPTQSDLGIVVITANKNNEETPVQTFYTKTKDGKFTVRGYEPKVRRFSAYIKDRFGNLSDTVYKDITPIFETLLDRFKFKKVELPSDRLFSYGWVMEGMWDDKYGEAQGFHTVLGAGLPLWFTFDLGVTAKLSRFKKYDRREPYVFSHGNMRKYEIWGIATTPPADGSFTGWTKLGSYEAIKPSGLPVGQNTPDDIKVNLAGEENNIDINNPPVRYIRIKMLQNWSNSDFVHVMEMKFWGNPQ
ncbi:DUF5000 domain-containing lipoprotein [Pedobacter sp. GSP4]|uniref:DUF5000 domain-containing lipoprotein n=1 Tax=Pedobacter sp. GSP4 TaxID=3453716 RepID=UPI003EEACB73